MASDNELLIFGYACKVYHDDEKALQVENALIPWMGDETITIDRYDGRGHLNSIKEFEPKNGFRNDSSSPAVESDEELAETERWLALRDDETKEEILKRAAAPVESHFAEIGFNYEENRAETFEDRVGVENRPQDFEDPDAKPYKVPKGLTVPVTVPRPDTRREHIIIQKTATFVARQGAQLEVVIKAKQKDNQQFAFMDIEHRLNLYYRYLVQQIKSGTYRPIENEENSDSDSDSSDGYLHPSLFAKSSAKKSGPPEELKNLFKSSTNRANCAYSQLISKIRPNLNEQQDSSQDDDVTINSLKDLVVVMPPPPDVQPIVDKMAEYVAKNGKDFEDSIRAKGDSKFSFILPDHEFYEYYQYKVKEFKLEESGVSKVASQESAPEVAVTEVVKPKSPNGLQQIALNNSYHNSSIDITPKIRRVEKKKLKISLKNHDKSTTEKKSTCQSLVGPLLPSLYDDEEDVLIQNQPAEEGNNLEKNDCEKKEESQVVEEKSEYISIEIHASNSEDSRNDMTETVVLEDSPKTPSENKNENFKFDLKENSNSTYESNNDPLKKKQLERKQKLAAFLSKLKSKNNRNESMGIVKTNILEESPPSPPSSSIPLQQPDLKSTIRNLRKAVVESDSERNLKKSEKSKKHSHDDKYESKRRSPSTSERKYRKHKKRDRSRSNHSSDNDDGHDEDLRRRRRREKKRRRSSSNSRDSSRESRSRSYSSRKHHKSQSARSRRD